MAASTEQLKDLHALVAKTLTHRIQQDMEDEVPTDAATLGAAIKFLKDNNVSADPADKDDINNLREKMKEQAEQRKRRSASVLNMVRGDLKQANGG